jgi:hypothetical protein
MIFRGDVARGFGGQFSHLTEDYNGAVMSFQEEA